MTSRRNTLEMIHPGPVRSIPDDREDELDPRSPTSVYPDDDDDEDNDVETLSETRTIRPLSIEKLHANHRISYSDEKQNSNQEEQETEHRPLVGPTAELNSDVYEKTEVSGSYYSRTLPQTIYDDVLYEEKSLHKRWARFCGKGRRRIGWLESVLGIVAASWLNLLLIFIPLAWTSHFVGWSHVLTFVLCFIAIIPLERLLEYGGEQMAFYCGRDLGDLVAITLNNMVEATLAIFLLVRCDLKLLQSTIVGVILLHLLFIPGIAFITGGVRIIEQDLNPHFTQMNHTLLTVGVLTLLLPAAFFSAINRGNTATPSTANMTERSVMDLNVDTLISDMGRSEFLKMSRGLAIILLVVYICSRIYLQRPPKDDKGVRPKVGSIDGLEEVKEEEEHLERDDPEINSWACLLLLAVTVTLLAVTAQCLVDSIEPVREAGKIQESFFGLILLPLTSFSADGAIAAGYFLRSFLRVSVKHSSPPPVPTTLAEGRAIDMSIQFALFWMPLLVLLGWWTGKPMMILFDSYEVALLLSAAFLVNYVTADAKTNWAEGSIMVAFYIMVALCSWFYPGQSEISAMLQCESVQQVLMAEPSGVIA